MIFLSYGIGGILFIYLFIFIFTYFYFYLFLFLLFLFFPLGWALRSLEKGGRICTIII